MLLKVILLRGVSNILKTWIYTMIIITISIGLIGCISNEKPEVRLESKEIVNIRVECSDLCKNRENPPFLEKTFEHSNDIGIFVKAINNSTKFEGMLDYGIIFLMHISFIDGTQKTYVLNIGDEIASKGLFVETVGNYLGYSIPEKYHAQLSKLIYH